VSIALAALFFFFPEWLSEVNGMKISGSQAGGIGGHTYTFRILSQHFRFLGGGNSCVSQGPSTANSRPHCRAPAREMSSDFFETANQTKHTKKERSRLELVIQEEVSTDFPDFRRFCWSESVESAQSVDGSRLPCIDG